MLDREEVQVRPHLLESGDVWLPCVSLVGERCHQLCATITSSLNGQLFPFSSGRVSSKSPVEWNWEWEGQAFHHPCCGGSSSARGDVNGMGEVSWPVQWALSAEWGGKDSTLSLPAPPALPSGHIPRPLGASLSYCQGISQKSERWVGSWTLLGENGIQHEQGEIWTRNSQEGKEYENTKFAWRAESTDWKVIWVFSVTFRLVPDPGWWTASILLEFEGRAVVHLVVNARAGWKECHS